MYGPYSSKIKDGKKIISYNGNLIDQPIIDVRKIEMDKTILDNRLKNIVNDQRYYHLHEIDNTIFTSTVNYFAKINTNWCNLPLTTLMISSPGEVYAGQTLDYTTDTLPVDISWFDNNKKIFLSESSQFYLELRLLIDKVDKVFSIYNSFRKEKSDFCHLAEFQHIEFEGKVTQQENISIITELLKEITNTLVNKNYQNLSYFLKESEIKSLTETFNQKNIETITFQDALAILFKDTNNEIYKEFSLKHFHSWEEVRLTEILNKHVLITEFPLLQIPFYHNKMNKEVDGILVADNADLILYGFRETVGSGARITDPQILAEKAKVFNLPLEDYAPYLQTRDYENYQSTAGFGLGWQRLVHWLLKLPFIWDACHIPRTHFLPKP